MPKGVYDHKKGKDSNSWKGDDIGYWGVHRWIYDNFGKANKCENKNCLGLSNKFEWSNNSGKYKRDRSDYEMLCKLCHAEKDSKDYCKNGHPLFGDNCITWANGQRKCRACKKEWKSKQSEEWHEEQRRLARIRFRRRYGKKCRNRVD